MQQQEQIRLLEQARALVTEGRTDLSQPGGELPVERYTDPQRFERERRVLFRRLPLLVGFGSQVRRPGDWFTHDLSGVPILCVRGDDGVLRAFLNVCRHRGARLVQSPLDGAGGSEQPVFSCWFHGWTYGNDGALRKLPVPEAFPDLDRAGCGLVELPCAERHGLVFAVPTPGVELDIDDYLGPLIAELGSFGLGDYVMTSPGVQTRRLNWKLHMDATQEVYHLPYLHAETAGAGYFHNCSILEHRAPHGRMVMPGPSVKELDDGARDRWRLLDHAAVVYALFPNTTLLLHMGYVELLSVFPVDTDTSKVRTAMLVPGGAVDYQEVFQRKSHLETYLSTMEEDLTVCEQMQANMRTGANAALRLGRAESLLAQFHRTVDRVVDELAARS
ncbi:MAG: aromatic ring-hydroxylating dioxygenase subunit alpha [Planctomycetota bacterium]